jgi:hypothetical protein
MTILSKIILEEWTLIWTIRNQVIHGHNQTSHLNIQRLEAKTKLRAIYDDRKLLLPVDQDHLFDDVNIPTSSTSQQIHQWRNNLKQIFWRASKSILWVKQTTLPWNTLRLETRS